jgi:hypothetical protein
MFEPKIKIFTNFLKFVCGKYVTGITLCPFGIYVKNIKSISVINHEKIHWQQQLELFILPFYIWYFIEWLIKLFFFKDAYRNISFEREAYNNDLNNNYLKSRKPYAWIKLIFKNNYDK